MSGKNENELQLAVMEIKTNFQTGIEKQLLQGSR